MVCFRIILASMGPKISVKKPLRALKDALTNKVVRGEETSNILLFFNVPTVRLNNQNADVHSIKIDCQKDLFQSTIVN